MDQIGILRMGGDEDAAAQGVRGKGAQDVLAQGVERRGAGMRQRLLVQSWSIGAHIK